MSDVAIRCDHLSKQYRIGERESYKALRDVITDAVSSPIRWARTTLNGRRSADSQPSDNGRFWALDDVSFEVKRGEVVGIIGRNGAGKSTLLKILSRITRPTRGRAEIHGRVGSLLEVGTGFHPELTGRENIFLNAAILGMRKTVITKKFDEIVAFAEVEKFIDTPVKRYSSGMYVRLAFAVAAHMEPDILVVDEVLAVGDAQFQRKCLGKMGEVSQNRGCTVLFVSHNMASLLNLCGKGLLLRGGQLEATGSMESVVGDYLAENSDASGEARFSEAQSASDEIKLTRIALKNQDGEVSGRFDARESITFEVEFASEHKVNNVELVIRIYTAQGTPVFSSMRSPYIPDPILPGKHVEQFVVPGLFLSPGSFLVYAACFRWGEKLIEEHHNCLRFEVEETGTAMAKYYGAPHGVILANFPWRNAPAGG
jgi:lipopolysaccharide transport system ATP-binding protein